jgi:hypothetical protein
VLGSTGSAHQQFKVITDEEQRTVGDPRLESGSSSPDATQIPPGSSGDLPREQLRKVLGFVRITEGLTFPPVEWVIEGFWISKAVGFIGGPPKSLKSWVALQMAVSVTTGRPFLGWEVRSQGPVLYFVGEGKMEMTLKRLDAMLTAMDLRRHALQGRLSVTRMPQNLEVANVRAAVAALVKEEKPILVIFDPLARFLQTADENSASEMRPVTNFLTQELTGICETSVLVIHHCNKEGRGLRGTGDLLAASDVTLLLGKKRNDDTVPVEEIIMKDAEEMDPFDLKFSFHKNAQSGELGSAALERIGAILRGKPGRPKKELDPERIAFTGRLVRSADIAGLSTDELKGHLSSGAAVAERLAQAAGATKQRGRWVIPSALAAAFTGKDGSSEATPPGLVTN